MFSWINSYACTHHSVTGLFAHQPGPSPQSFTSNHQGLPQPRSQLSVRAPCYLSLRDRESCTHKETTGKTHPPTQQPRMEMGAKCELNSDTPELKGTGNFPALRRDQPRASRRCPPGVRGHHRLKNSRKRPLEGDTTPPDGFFSTRSTRFPVPPALFLPEPDLLPPRAAASLLRQHWLYSRGAPSERLAKTRSKPRSSFSFVLRASPRRRLVMNG